MPRAMVDASCAREEDSPMAKRPTYKAKGTKAKRAKGGSFGRAMKALEDAGVPAREFGQFKDDGAPAINFSQLEGLKKKLGRGALKRVRFVALNAPFKRRSPIPPV